MRNQRGLREELSLDRAAKAGPGLQGNDHSTPRPGLQGNDHATPEPGLQGNDHATPGPGLQGSLEEGSHEGGRLQGGNFEEVSKGQPWRREQ
jgi:hypothetical protein